jgi:hypothetical protein
VRQRSYLGGHYWSERSALIRVKLDEKWRENGTENGFENMVITGTESGLQIWLTEQKLALKNG